MPGRSILITGCSSGIGHHCAHALQKRGYNVVASARKKEDVVRLSDEGLTCIQLDLDNPDSIAAAVEQTLKLTGGTLYALFNNGAYGQPGAVEDLSRKVLRDQFETNLFGTHELTCRLIPVMRKQGEGRIIQNSSVLGFIAFRYRGAYIASKYALEGLTDTLRLELHGTSIHVSLIEPGPILSDFRKKGLVLFRKNIDIYASVHCRKYQLQLSRLQTEGPAMRFTLGPESVCRRLVHALESNHPKRRYYVTFPTYLMGTLKRILPDRAMDWFLRVNS